MLEKAGIGESRRGRLALIAVPSVVLAALVACTGLEKAGIAKSEPRWTRTENGILLHPMSSDSGALRLELVRENILRVTAVPTADIPDLTSLMVIAEREPVPFTATESRGEVTLTTASLQTRIALDSGAVSLFRPDGSPVVATTGESLFSPVKVEGQDYYAVTQSFTGQSGEGLYGLGAHQTGEFNYRGASMELAQHNIVDAVPFLVSSSGYGILWDNNGITRFGDPRPYQALDQELTLTALDGTEGGLTGRYFLENEIVLTRIEADPDFQYLPPDEYLRDPPGRYDWPAELGGEEPSKVVWEGTMEAHAAGKHSFNLYASNYYKVWIDGEIVIDRWRQNWNPWHHKFELEMQPGAPRTIKVEWIPNGGYYRLQHLSPRSSEDANNITLTSETAKAIDYYVVVGTDIDGVISGYRELTGPAVMLPKWAYGFWQSRQRYTRQDELLDVVKEYRKRAIPFDNIVLDWFYWPEDAWGSHAFDLARFPDAGGMVKAVHDLNAQIMISVWPKFYPTTDNYKELDAGGHIYKRQIEMKSRDWVGPGYANSFYDPYSEEGRKIYWRQIEENLGRLGFDAWWMDATEPDQHSNLSYPERALRMGPTAMGPGAEFFNSYVLMNSQAIFEGEQDSKTDMRSFLLTRSAWGGIQRYASVVWSGDVTGRWEDLALQIPAGLNMALSGVPNWTHDIGGFAVEDHYTRQDPAHLEEWRELYSRWFQYGAFTPVFRSHGEFPFRETWNIAPEGSEVYDGLVYYHKLRYRLLPYIYTLAADTYHNDGTIMRALVMDFPDDPQAHNIGDQYMFGPAFHVAPVTEFKARTRDVYLPAGADWYDFYSGERRSGGNKVTVDAPLTRLPLHVRSGAIVPLGPEVQYALQETDGSLTIRVYRGADGAFSLYEDDGVTYAGQRGVHSRIPFSYSEANGTLTIGSRQGAYPGMHVQRTLQIEWIGGPAPGAETVTYSGSEIRVKAPG